MKSAVGRDRQPRFNSRSLQPTFVFRLSGAAILLPLSTFLRPSPLDYSPSERFRSARINYNFSRRARSAETPRHHPAGRSVIILSRQFNVPLFAV